jgi:uncharacterized membrane protein YedE/YeeE
MIQIAWNNFTPYTALLGGVLIGLSAAGLILLNGKILGVSSIFSGLLKTSSSKVGWGLMFLLGMFASPWIYQALLPIGLPVPQFELEISTSALIAAGLLVGYGTTLGSGCTSGHGVCGLSRMSIRSLIATLMFMMYGFLSVYIIRHVLPNF